MWCRQLLVLSVIIDKGMVVCMLLVPGVCQVPSSRDAPTHTVSVVLLRVPLSSPPSPHTHSCRTQFLPLLLGPHPGRPGHLTPVTQ